ncbi:MAG: hypothetical protein K0R75_1900 [Paenibacillaceae bacterium]|jgi:hypothetical protein|nr:hypothetical protein [Paenibacillaceae bacterium]
MTIQAGLAAAVEFVDIEGKYDGLTTRIQPLEEEHGSSR